MAKTVEAAVPVACWVCSAAQQEAAPFCQHCGKIQPPSGGDFFFIFGLRPRLDLDLAALEHEFHRLSRKLHPDRFARAAENEKQWSVAHSVLLNDAYRTLKDPIARTEYLLKSNGAAMGDEHSGHPDRDDATGPCRVPADLLEEVFDLNMQLEEMRMAHKTGEAEDPVLKQRLSAARGKFDAMRDAIDVELRGQWNAWDEGDAAARQAAQQNMIALLDRRRYLSNLVRDVRETLEGHHGGRTRSRH